MVVKGLKKKNAVTKKFQTAKFVVDCSQPVNDNVIDPAGLVYLKTLILFLFFRRNILSIVLK